MNVAHEQTTPPASSTQLRAGDVDWGSLREVVEEIALLAQLHAPGRAEFDKASQLLGEAIYLMRAPVADADGSGPKAVTA